MTAPEVTERESRRPGGMTRLVVGSVSAVLLLLVVASLVSGGGSDDAAADPAPTFTAPTFEGGEISLDDYAGTPLVVNFWASTCPPCRREMPDFQRVYEDLDGEVEFVGLAFQDAENQAQEFVDVVLPEETGTRITYPLAFDTSGDIGRRYSILGLPHTVVIDDGGEIVAEHAGILDEAALREILRESVPDLEA